MEVFKIDGIIVVHQKRKNYVLMIGNLCMNSLQIMVQVGTMIKCVKNGSFIHLEVHTPQVCLLYY